MAIKFDCPHCHKTLNVKDHLAGKRAACPACKKIFTIPTPQALPADLEDLAVSALAEPTALAAPAAGNSKTIDMTCAYCDAKLHLSMDLAGKQTPCPECRRIIKVPLPSKNEPKDWRTINTRLPLGARRETEPAPEGAWGTATSSGAVSRQALEEAEAIPDSRERPSRGRRLVRGGIAIVGLLLVGLLVWGGLGWWSRNQRDQVVVRALKAVGPESGHPQEPLEMAAVHQSAGEYYLRTRQRDCATKASNLFRKARDLTKSSEGLTHDLMLTRLALLQIDLSEGGAEDRERGLCLTWENTHRELARTLDLLKTVEGRLYALRMVGRKLMARGQALATVDMATRMMGSISPPSGKPGESLPAGLDALGIMGLELMYGGENQLAEQLTDQALKSAAKSTPVAKEKEKGKEGNQQRSYPLSSSLVALCTALNKPVPKPSHGTLDEENFLVGQAEGLALQGNFGQARALIGKSTLPSVRWRMLTALACVSGHGNPPDPTDFQNAMNLTESELKGRDLPPWQLHRLVEVALHVRQVDRGQRLADLIHEPELRSWAQLEVLRARFSGLADKADESLISNVGQQGFMRALAREALARHNAQYDSSLAKTIDTWDEPLRPLGYVGMALGLQDKTR